MEREEEEHVSKWTGQEYTQERHTMQSEKLGNKYTKWSFLMRVTQSCLTLCNAMDCSLPGSSVHESPGENTGVGCHFLLQGIFLTQESNAGLPHCEQTL